MLRSFSSVPSFSTIHDKIAQLTGLAINLSTGKRENGLKQIGLHGTQLMACLGLALIFGLSASVDASNAGPRISISKNNHNISSQRISGYRSHRLGQMRNHHSKYRAYKNRRGKYNSYRGPLIINVPSAIRVHRGNTDNNAPYIFDNSSWLKRHEIENGGVLGSSRPRAIFYNDKKCNSGKTCIIRMGSNRNSPKLIVVGEQERKGSGPHIIRVPQ